MYKLNCLTTTRFYLYVLYCCRDNVFCVIIFQCKKTATLYGLFLTRNEAALFWEQDYLVALLFFRSM